MNDSNQTQDELLALLLQYRLAHPSADEPSGEAVEFHALLPTAKLTGRYYIFGDRLSDALNREEALSVTDARTLDLESGSVQFQPHAVVRRPDLLIVVATGPRGSARRRFRTQQHPITLQIGPYVISAMVHMAPGGSAVPGIYQRQVMVPLTEARIEYTFLGRPIVEAYDTVIANRNAIESLVQDTDSIPWQLRLGAPGFDPARGPGGAGGDDLPTFRSGSSTPPYLPRPDRKR